MQVSGKHISLTFCLLFLIAPLAYAQQPIGNFKAAKTNPAEEDYVFTPPGFDKPGQLLEAEGDQTGQLQLTVRDSATGKPTPCRVNVVGPDGNFYQPDSDLKPYGFTDNWPNNDSRGNRLAKGPIRYLGWFFYTRGTDIIRVPAGKVQIEVNKGFEYRPVTKTVSIEPGQTLAVEINLEHTLAMRELGYCSGDPHIHVPRQNKADDQLALDLCAAEGIYYGSILCYNEPPGMYTGIMNTQDMPQTGMGIHSLRARGPYEIVSGQEYRSAWYGHLNLFMHDELVLPGKTVNADDGPIYGELAQKVRDAGGIAVYAHGGYALEVYADAIQENIDAIELLQFSKYRGLGLQDWYHLLNAGFQIPITGASDYPACRHLGDCKTYVYHDQLPGFGAWYRGMADGQSFVTSGPMLLLEVDGKRPGETITPTESTQHEIVVRVNSEIAPVTHLQIIVGGQVVKEIELTADQARAQWFELKHTIQLDESSWIAARAFSKSPFDTPDAESHTNPVYVTLNGKAPYNRQSVDVLMKELDRQIAYHQSRNIKTKAQAVAYFLKSKDILQEIHKAGGRLANTDDRKQRQHLVEANAKAVAGDEKALKEVLRSVPPKTPEEVLDTFTTTDQFHLELVAHEPLLNDPICAAFDADGRLYVGQMTDYPYFPREGEKPIGSVCVLEDTDDDGRFDRSTQFAEQLLWVGGIAPWKGGVFVAAPPDIWYLKDTDGDLKADVRRKVFTGFGTQNQQGMLNNLKWGPDFKIYGSTSVNGGKIIQLSHPDSKPVLLDGHDFRFDPVTETIEPVSGKKQFGNSFDDWGNRFVCSQGEPLLHVVLPQHYLARNPYLTTTSTLNSLAPVPTPVFRTSPVEMWREIRSRRRIFANRSPATGTGVSHHVIDAGAGCTVYRGGAYPKEYYGNVFIGGAQNNLVHRRILEPAGATFTSKRGDPSAEVVQSTDNWFRPVNFVNAPDGTLYILDMAREILEAIHIPLDVVKHLDLRSGRDHGRIYRLAPNGFQSPPTPKLSQASTTELVESLKSSHGWYRDTAQRLLFERQDPQAIEPLRKLLLSEQSPQSRYCALWVLKGLNALQESDLLPALANEDPQIRTLAAQLSEPLLNDSQKLREKVYSLATDPAAEVRFQLAFTLGEVDDPQAVHILASFARKYASDSWMRTAVLSSATEQTDYFIISLLRNENFATTSVGKSMLRQLAQLVGAKNIPKQTSKVLNALQVDSYIRPNRDNERLIIQSIGEGLKLSGKKIDRSAIQNHMAEKLVETHFEEATKTALDENADLTQRQQAITLLGYKPFTDSNSLLETILSSNPAPELQLPTLDTLGSYNDSSIASMILSNWAQYSPQVLSRAIQILLSREDWTIVLLEAAEDESLTLAQIDSNQRDLLLENKNPTIQQLANQLFGKAKITPRDEIIQQYQTSLQQPGDPTRGEQVFTKTCAVCHSIAGKGHAVGPDLTSIGSLDPEAMLVHILDPNRYVLPRYIQYVVVDVQGKMHTGLMSSQTASSITLVREERASETLLRTNIEEIQATQKSLMPEGLEAKLTTTDMADLIAYITTARKQHGIRPENDQQAQRDFGTLPGLIEPKE